MTGGGNNMLAQSLKRQCAHGQVPTLARRLWLILLEKLKGIEVLLGHFFIVHKCVLPSLLHTASPQTYNNKVCYSALQDLELPLTAPQLPNIHTCKHTLKHAHAHTQTPTSSVLVSLKLINHAYKFDWHPRGPIPNWIQVTERLKFHETFRTENIC